MVAPVRDAVTAVLINNGQVFVTVRHRALPAFPGYIAFPGGKIEREDDQARFDGGALVDHPPRLIHGLARELDEELQFNFIGAYRDGEVRGLHCLGEATTPAFVPLRFRTWFYRIDLRNRPDFKLDQHEFEGGWWADPAELVAEYHRGRLLVVPPTLAVLRALVNRPATTRVHDMAPDDRDDHIPMIEPLHGLRMLAVPSNTLPPATRTNCFVIGDDDAPKVLVDPAPKNDATYDMLRSQVEKYGIDLILLTHHHADHRERADRLAREFDVPLAMSADTHTRLSQRGGGRLLKGVTVHRLSADEVVTQWLGEAVRVVLVPGHDAGQVALMPSSRAWMIVGDLIQGIGTVVIAPPEGDMATYFDTMRRVIDLAPDVVVPSHGGAMGSVYRIEKALEHRQQREDDILRLHLEGLSEDRILAELYSDIDQRLLPLAQINVRGHLDKLEFEGRLERSY